MVEAESPVAEEPPVTLGPEMFHIGSPEVANDDDSPSELSECFDDKFMPATNPYNGGSTGECQSERLAAQRSAGAEAASAGAAPGPVGSSHRGPGAMVASARRPKEVPARNAVGPL